MSRRAVIASSLGGVAIVGAGILGGPVARRDPVTPGTPSMASPAATPVGEAIEVAIRANGLRFSPSAISIPAHTPVRIVFTNPGRVYHDLVIPGIGRRTPRIGPGETAELVITVEPGSYGFHCSIQSHHQAGMEGTLTAS
jgi:nitrite reductase (NO-forming)